MDQNSKVIGMINARGGSKGIPRKNVKPLDGLPLIAWSIETALKVPSISYVMVSTEDEEIAQVAREHGAEVPFMRPAKLAQDNSIQLDTIIYNVEKLEEMGQQVDAVALLQPTHPLRDINDVQGCIDTMIATQADTVITTAPNRHHPLGVWQDAGEQGLELFLDDPDSKQGFNRQNMKPLYWRTGSVYLMTRETIMDKKTLYGDHVEGYLVDNMDSWIDIDTLQDWELAEAWISHQKNKPA